MFVKGLVQGVGFRPFIYKVATSFSLRGTVENRNDGVKIILQGDSNSVEDFLDILNTQSPPASHITSVKVDPIQYDVFYDFRILKSRNVSDEITMVSPDIGVCNDCLTDMIVQEPRINYPFTNCTNCGPRFTIIEQLPYDRPNTTMQKFEMCSFCKNEYEDVQNRRFHAQPVACKNCGPHYTLHHEEGEINDQEDIITRMSSFLSEGKIIAVKGLGGFFLACDATNAEAVGRLRSIKKREGKPFAVMFADINAVRKYASVSISEENALRSWKRPIVLVKSKGKLAHDVSMDFPTIGAMLPYMPFHYLLFDNIEIDALVLTSGNLSDEPILIHNNVALETFLPICDAVLTYNRKIQNRVDDSLLQLVLGKEMLLRRSRGFAPAPIILDLQVDGIMAVGAELVNCFCMGKSNQAILSQHIGDLKNLETYEFFSESISRYKKLFRIEPELVVADMHPEYLSTKYAMETNLPIMQVQHHHAHIVSVMAEHQLDETVIGIAFDGVGYGDDGKIWGGEFLVCNIDSYKRETFFDYQAMPGGDQATMNPWRMAISYLYGVYGRKLLDLKLPFMKEVDPNTLEMVIQMMEKKINCPLTSSAGRLFDAVAALTGLCTRSTFHAEAPMRLESLINEDITESYAYSLKETIVLKPMIKEIVYDLQNSIPVSTISAKFHNTIIQIALEVSEKLRKKIALNKVVLSGGTFQNKYILQRMQTELAARNFEVYINEKVPCNDGGIALGQLAIAAKRKL
ncbi:MAG: carbamoyltransferase HypF [Bacteroidales bacterium]|nr:carbamoyltransferase HypF [Bacteroidales bacterium]